MTPEQEIAQLRLELEELKTLLYKDNFSALQILRKQQQLADGINLELGSSDGTKIGTAITQKLAFYGVTPVDQPATISDPSGGATTDAEARTAINTLIDRLQELGLIA